MHEFGKSNNNHHKINNRQNFYLIERDKQIAIKELGNGRIGWVNREAFGSKE